MTLEHAIPTSPPGPTHDLRLLAVGDGALTVEFGHAIDPTIHARVLGFAQTLDALVGSGQLEGVVEWVPTFRSVTVHFDPDQADPAQLAEALLALARRGASATVQGCRWHIPVCFEADFAPDLADLAAARGLAEAEVRRLMTETVFTVHMLGFLPGFAYLGGLPTACEMPRLATPRKVVPARSIAVAGRMCAAYPWESPGGWRLLGRTPIRLFDAANPRRPALLAPGDEVQWRVVDSTEYAHIEQQIAAGRFDVTTLLEGGAQPQGAHHLPPLGCPKTGSPLSEGGTQRRGTRARAALEVVDGGLAVTVQDRGRFGYRDIGVPLSGALDPVLLAAANALLGNAADAAGLEVVLTGPGLKALSGTVRVALAGALGGRVLRARGPMLAVQPWSSATLAPGDTLQVGSVAEGIGYVAVSGGVAVPEVLGSRSTYRRAALGGVQGRALAMGDVLPCAEVEGDLGLECRGPAPLAFDGGPIRVILGPQQDHFTATAVALFLSQPYTVSRDLDRMGMRLEGAVLAHNEQGAEILSDGVVPGSIQVPADGQPIILLADCQTTGGYPKIATVIRADLPRLGHARPGTVLRFASVSLAEAAAARRALAQRLARWVGGVESFRPPGVFNEAALSGGNLISGAVRGDEPAP